MSYIFNVSWQLPAVDAEMLPRQRIASFFLELLRIQ